MDQVDPYHQNMDDLDGNGLDPYGLGMSKGSSTSSFDGGRDRENERMVSVVMLGSAVRLAARGGHIIAIFIVLAYYQVNNHY